MARDQIGRPITLIHIQSNFPNLVNPSKVSIHTYRGVQKNNLTYQPDTKNIWLGLEVFRFEFNWVENVKSYPKKMGCIGFGMIRVDLNWESGHPSTQTHPTHLFIYFFQVSTHTKKCKMMEKWSLKLESYFVFAQKNWAGVPSTKSWQTNNPTSTIKRCGSRFDR